MIITLDLTDDEIEALVAGLEKPDEGAYDDPWFTPEWIVIKAKVGKAIEVARGIVL